MLTLIIILLTLFIFLRPWRIVARFSDAPLPAREALPSVSVVTYATRDAESLSEYLDILLNQDYPDFEVIVVCDASAETTAMISERFEGVSHLHITFIPPGSHNVSRRKLAQTIGVKAASKDVVVITSTSVTPRSDKWLLRLAAPMADPGYVMSLGYVNHPFSSLKGAGKWYRQFDFILTSAQWLAAAVEGNPFRGDGFNLAFRREAFFRIKGYASSFTLTDGDDDIFIHDLSELGKCGVTLHEDSIVDALPGKFPDRKLSMLKERYMFTRRFLPKRPFMLASLAEWANWLVPLPAVASAVVLIFSLYGDTLCGAGIGLTDHMVMLHSIILTAAVSAFFTLLCLAFQIAEIMMYRRLAKRMDAVRLFWCFIPFILWRPVGNLLFRIRHRKSLRSRYAWHN